MRMFVVLLMFTLALDNFNLYYLYMAIACILGMCGWYLKWETGYDNNGKRITE